MVVVPCLLCVVCCSLFVVSGVLLFAVLLFGVCGVLLFVVCCCFVLCAVCRCSLFLVRCFLFANGCCFVFVVC